ncbi:hypothetical protein [Lichenifustis flavocetrariae]|uniref:Uncharacterized protein n=1 Tax=Lichenifustis flavocetrariae TaxID=2949735 RepID=A0AA41YQG1_9HYPH|nr:hypothetical protein [Lichenifustis flavocetrariae]MCW6506674.1 hypothetical protein [Lichenifustis flavocetrariae]
MFDFITISNGIAIVQHTEDGHVYRFKPVQPGKWDKLIFLGSDANEAASSSTEMFAVAALRFAERAAAECMCGNADIPEATSVQDRGGLSAWLNRLRIGPRLPPKALEETGH